MSNPTGEPVSGPVARELLPVASARGTARVTWGLLRERPGPLVATVLAYVGVGLGGLVGPWALGAVVDVVREQRPARELTALAVLVAVAAVAVGGLTAVAAASLARSSAPALARLREAVLERAVHLDVRRLEAAGTGDVSSRVGDDVRTVSTALTDTVPTTLVALVTTAFTGAGLFALDWRLGLAGLLAVPCYLGALRWYLRRSAPLYRRERVAQGERAEALLTGLQGAVTLRAFGRTGAARDRVRSTSRAAAGVALDVFGVLLRWGMRMNGSEYVGLALVLGAGFLLVRSGAGTLGEATAAALYFHRLFNPVGVLLFSFDDVQAAGASLARMVGVAGIAPAGGDTRPPARTAALQLEDVGHSYSPGRSVLAGVTLTLAPGEHVAVVGATGAGKTTLGAVAAGRLTPTRGQVRADGVGLRGLHPRAVAAHVAHVSQELHVFAGSVADNLTLARGDASGEQLRAALSAVGAQAWVEALPAGLATVVGEGGTSLTAAQTQQLALARVLLADPPVVVLDEASAEAGSYGARELDAAAAAATAGRAALVIAHRLSQASRCDRIVVLDAGRVVETGTHAALLATGGRYARLWQAWEPAGAPQPDGALPQSSR